jgi:hypothetical protein
MSDAVLDALRLTLFDSRREGPDQPVERRKRIFVDPGGRIVIGDDVEDGDGLQLSEVHQAVFASPGA